MKIKTRKSEIRECVAEAVMRLIREGKTFKKSGTDKSDDFDGRKTPWYPKMNKNGIQKKDKGNKGNRNYREYDEEC